MNAEQADRLRRLMAMVVGTSSVLRANPQLSDALTDLAFSAAQYALSSQGPEILAAERVRCEMLVARAIFNVERGEDGLSQLRYLLETISRGRND